MFTEKLLWKIFFFEIAIIAIKGMGALFGLEFAQHPLMKFAILLIPVITLSLHSIITLTAKRAVMFIALAGSIGFLAEYIGMYSGILFGGQYVYATRAIMLAGVPAWVVLYWAVFVYIGYNVVNSFFLWKKQSKPNVRKKDAARLLPLICFDALVVTAIDVFMDPIQVRDGKWTWIDGGPYFGVPYGNFLGWLFVVGMISAIWRTFEYYRPIPEPKVSREIYLIPLIGYTLFWATFVASAISMQLYGLIFIGSAAMLPTISFALLSYVRRTRKSPTFSAHNQLQN